MTGLSVVHAIACLDPETGGPARTVSSLTCALEAMGILVGLVTQAPRPGDPPPAVPGRVVWTPRGKVRGARAFARALEALVAESAASVLHDHGVWLPTNHLAAGLARRLGLPRVVSPRGMLDGWALSWHGGRKRVAWRLYQRRDLASADLLHATSEAEAMGLRRLGLGAPIAVVPNGVEVPEDIPAKPPAGRDRMALFLSRIHPKKGLPDLLEAWRRVAPRGWRLRVVGMDDGEHARYVRALADRLGVAADVEWREPVGDAAKRSLFGEADLLVLPTHSENFGLVVAEALAHGVPALTTRAAPWALLESERCGWWVEVGPHGIEEGLRRAVAETDAQRREMGTRGREVVRIRFGWPAVAAALAAAYAWLVAGAPMPACVRLVGRTTGVVA